MPFCSPELADRRRALLSPAVAHRVSPSLRLLLSHAPAPVAATVAHARTQAGTKQSTRVAMMPAGAPGGAPAPRAPTSSLLVPSLDCKSPLKEVYDKWVLAWTSVGWAVLLPY